jgi:1,4-dihydroxy-2-naphthoate octaprenyltransferase
MRTSRTPFSGGSGTLPARPDLARGVLATAIVCAGATALVGVYFLIVRGPLLLPVGLLGLLVVLAYTSWFTRSPVLCLVVPGLGFGTFMVMGTHFVLTGEYSWTAFVASCVPFFLVSNLLLLNQFPDVEADRSVGRRHLPIVVGRRASSLVYGAFLLLAYLTIVIGVQLGYLPVPCLIALLTLALAVPTALGVYRHAEDPEERLPLMGRNVVITIVTPLLVSVGLFIG